MAKTREPTKPKPPNTTEQLLSRQMDAISEVFRSFGAKYDLCSNRRPLFLSDTVQLTVPTPIDLAAWKSKLSQLQSSLLPLLRHQIKTLSSSLDPSDLRKDKCHKLELIVQLQSELGHTMGQVVSCATFISPRPLFSPIETDDHYLKDLKEFRRKKLFFKVSFLTRELSFLFGYCATLIQQLKLSRNKYRREARRLNARGMIIKFSGSASDSIDSLIRWSQGHEMEIIHQEWDLGLSGMDEVLANLAGLDSPAVATGNADEDDQTETDGASEPVIQLARYAQPIAKLSRLFFRKLATSRLNPSPLHPFTDMSTDQLTQLCGSAALIGCHLGSIFKSLNINPQETVEADLAAALIETVNRTVEIF
ncbi:hypothetical protein PTTG_09236 [Puccinia triticina 1-1 BBBD Race 1]|uniref:Uncharacterized protein n=1 Tax=Puccinia triticina (isolate 1-1 / race 1 (BBBD)) TaxID=630390 RepID=A0A0C4F7V2_PUCT1|nr:hypothetical protein PTTG_09236 [Puccinia triticina 1-1 BBBD Race 1]